MNKQIVVDFDEKRIILGAAFSEKAKFPGSKEYITLQGVRHDFPDFTVVVRTIKKPTRKESYKGLHYPYMERYIAGHDPDGSIRKEYDKLRLLLSATPSDSPLSSRGSSILTPRSRNTVCWKRQRTRLLLRELWIWQRREPLYSLRLRHNKLNTV